MCWCTCQYGYIKNGDIAVFEKGQRRKNRYDLVSRDFWYKL